jgi:hypothetical protein
MSGIPKLVEQAGGPASPATEAAGEGCNHHRSAQGCMRGRCPKRAELEAVRVLPDGTLNRSDVTDKRMATRAQADVMRFNVPTAGSWI